MTVNQIIREMFDAMHNIRMAQVNDIRNTLEKTIEMRETKPDVWEIKVDGRQTV